MIRQRYIAGLRIVGGGLHANSGMVTPWQNALRPR